MADGYLGFETAIEKLARVLTRNTGIDVRFEGNKAFTDPATGTIVLPYFAEIDTELYEDLNGFLDIEASKILHSNPKEMEKPSGRFHFELATATEGVRAKNKYLERYPGSQMYMGRLEKKWKEELKKKWAKLPWPVRLIHNIRERMEGIDVEPDADVESQFLAVEPFLRPLAKAKSTAEVVELTERITKAVIEDREREKKKSGADKSKDEHDKMCTMPRPKDGESEASKSAGGKAKDWDGLDQKEQFDQSIENQIAQDGSKSDTGMYGYKADFSNTSPHIPLTTKFDTIKNHVGKGNITELNKMKQEMIPVIRRLKTGLERRLMAVEAVNTRYDREEGELNHLAFVNMIIDPNFNTAFKDHTSGETRNVAVEMLIDLSGSMGGQKVRCAQKCALAIGVALYELGIQFEVTGFHSYGDTGMQRYARTVGNLGRFNRMNERLEHHVFKEFDNHVMTGITEVYAGGNNTDSESVAWAARRLWERKEARKILIVLSDGSPASEGNSSILCNDLKKKVKGILKSGIECIGIGIESTSVTSFYPDHIIVNNVEELGMRALSKLMDVLEKGASRAC